VLALLEDPELIKAEIDRRLQTLRAELDALDTQLRDAETYLKLTETLDAFRARLTANARTLTIEQRQEIVRLVVREVLLGDDDVTIRHSIPLPSNGQPGGSLPRSQHQGAQEGHPAVFGNDVSVQRCIEHKQRNVLDHLPERDREPVKARLRRAGRRPTTRLRWSSLRRWRSSSTTSTRARPPRSGRGWRRR